MVLDASLVNTQYHKVQIKGKWINPGKGVVSTLHFNVEAIEKETLGSASTTAGEITMYIIGTKQKPLVLARF